MALDYFEEEGSEPMAEEAAPQEGMDDGESPKTCLVDASIYPGGKVGDEFTARIEKVLDSGEFVITRPEGYKEEPEPPMEETMGPESEVAGYME